MKIKRSPFLHALFLVSVLCAWELLTRRGVISSFFVGSPTGICGAFLELAGDPASLRHAGSSLGNLLAGYFLAVLAAVGLGLPIGYFRGVYANVRGYVRALYSVPRIAFIPLVILWLGVGNPAKIFIVFMLTFFTVFIAAMEAAKTMDRDLADVCAVYGAGRLATLRYLVLPSAAGPVTAGAKIAVGRAITGMILSETFGQPRGLGYLLFHYGASYRTNKMMAVLLAIVLLSLSLFYLVDSLERKFIRWR